MVKKEHQESYPHQIRFSNKDFKSINQSTIDNHFDTNEKPNMYIRLYRW